MGDPERQEANREAREAWDVNAGYWDDRMGEGNDWVEHLTWPASERLLAIQPGERVLDAACGNGLTSRRLAKLQARVTAFDFSAEMIRHARERSEDGAIDFRVLDGTDREALLALGEGSFDAALCAMALFDMAEIDPLFQALARLLRPGGRFVFSVLHPCFNNPYATHTAELEDRDGETTTTYSMKVAGYLSNAVTRARAIPHQPEPQPLFHRPLQELLGVGLRAGFVLDGLEETSFPPELETGTFGLSWSGRFHEIPPVLVVRMRRPGS